MRQALHAEWTKLRTAPGPAWLLAAAVVLTVALGTLVADSSSYAPGAQPQDPTKLALTGLYVGQAVVAAFGVILVAGEYHTGMIRTSLTATPRRLTLLGAKAAMLSALVLAAGAVAIVASLLAGRFILLANGFTTSHGYAAISFSAGPTLRAAVGSVLFLLLMALLGLGVAAAMRDSAVSIGVVLALLFLFPIVISFVTSADLQRHLQQIGPSTAGMDITDTVNLATVPLTPWQGLGVLALWAVGALAAGALVLRFRDA